MSKLVLGYSPFNEPSRNPIFPFNAIYDASLNLINQENLNGVDAVLLWGGNDISPTLYGMEPIAYSGPRVPTQRDLFEWEVLREAARLGKPIIGVCRGAQMICAFAGGVLAQDVIGHNMNHSILTYTGETFTVSSSHHQMMIPLDSVNYEELAWASKNLSSRYSGLDSETSSLYLSGNRSEAEVVYFNDINAMAIQCHPEWHTIDDPFNKWILQQMIEKQFQA